MKQGEFYQKYTNFGNFNRMTYIYIVSYLDGEIIRDMYWIDIMNNRKYDVTIREGDSCSESEIQDKYEICNEMSFRNFIAFVLEARKIEGR